MTNVCGTVIRKTQAKWGDLWAVLLLRKLLTAGRTTCNVNGAKITRLRTSPPLLKTSSSMFFAIFLISATKK